MKLNIKDWMCSRSSHSVQILLVRSTFSNKGGIYITNQGYVVQTFWTSGWPLSYWLHPGLMKPYKLTYILSEQPRLLIFAASNQPKSDTSLFGWVTFLELIGVSWRCVTQRAPAAWINAYGICEDEEYGTCIDDNDLAWPIIWM